MRSYSPSEGLSGRNHKETWAGCIVSFTTPTNHPDNRTPPRRRQAPVWEKEEQEARRDKHRYHEEPVRQPGSKLGAR
jgi:hypothetical protein